MTVPAVDKLLQDGLAHHRAGRAEAAADCYRGILEAEPENADALHLTGVLALQAGDWDTAAEHIERAIDLSGEVPAFHDHLAVVRRNQDRLAEAEAAHRRAIELDPKFASAYNNLATTLRQDGRMADAVRAARKALEAAPNDPVIAQNAAQLFMEAEAFSSAAAAFGKAVAADPKSATLREKQGVALFRCGQFEAAEAAFREAVRLGAGGPGAARRLAETLLMLERVEEAATAAKTLAEQYPDDARIHTLHGVAAMRAGEMETAEAACERALAVDAKHVPAIVGLAVIAAAKGDTDGAVRRYRDVLALDPDNVDAYGNLAGFGADGLTIADADHIAGLLARKSLPEDFRATLAFALTHYLNRVGERDVAWDWYLTGNMLRRAHLRGVGHVFDAARHGEFLEARRRVFTKGFFAAREGFGHGSEKPVFVISLPRSGTTLVERILAAHPEVHGAGELRDIPVAAIRRTPVLAGGETSYPDCVGDLSAVQVKALAAEHLKRLEGRAGKAASRVIDKMPFNFLHLGLIRLMFPKARIIHCRRDLRDVGLSCFTMNFAEAHAWTTDLADIAEYANGYRSLMAHWRGVLPPEIMTEVDYEALITDQEGESRRLIGFLGLEWDPACLAFHENEGVVTTASRAQVRRPIYATSVGRWRDWQGGLGDLLSRLEGGGAP